jgi:tetratricopeptide (TPR) repeat protein
LDARVPGLSALKEAAEMQEEVDEKIRRLKSVKSALILEAQALRDRGLAPFSRPFYQSAADAESELADLFRSLNRPQDAQISLFSAASCLVQAGQFQKAVPHLRRVLGAFPEAEAMLQECQGRKDEPLVADVPELRALIALLLRKGLINEAEWAQALETTVAR